MKKPLREPLVHFLLIGAGIFLLSGLRNGRMPFQLGGGTAQPAEIVITSGDVDSLIENFSNLWHRSPTAEELQGLIDGRVRQEVYYREAVKIGLDRDDTIVRNRLEEKLEFLSQDVKESAEPTEKDLKQFLAQHAEKFRTGAEYSFKLVFVDAGLHGAATRQTAEGILAKLNKNPTLGSSTKGDPLPFAGSFEHMAESDIAKMFGDEFRTALDATNPGKWTGPVATDDGIYLVYVKERREGHVPMLDEIRSVVRQQWLAAQRQESNDRFYRSLLQRYSVRVDMPKGGADGKRRDAEMIPP